MSTLVPPLATPGISRSSSSSNAGTSASSVATTPMASPGRSPRSKGSRPATTYKAGRAWLNTNDRRAFCIGVAGGTGSGKTTICRSIMSQLAVPWAVMLSMDSFYKELSSDELAAAERGEFNFDSPDAYDIPLMLATLTGLREGRRVVVPLYDPIHFKRRGKKTVYGADVILVEGILAFHFSALLPLMDLKLFISTDDDVRLARRLERDVRQRGRSVASVIDQYNRFVKPCYEEFIEPTMRHADVVVPSGKENGVAIQLIAENINHRLSKRGYLLRRELASLVFDETTKIPKNVFVLPRSKHVLAMHTILRNRKTTRSSFVFNADRLIRLMVEFTLSFLPFQEQTIVTPTGSSYDGLAPQTRMLCGVSIMRAGEAMETALRQVIKHAALGKILIQTNPENMEPELYYLKLPQDIELHRVILMDPMMGTGATLLMALRVLIDHGVKESSITIMTLIAAPAGLHAIHHYFPRVTIVTSAIDKCVDDQYFILPGMGNFGDRYFGTEREEDTTHATVQLHSALQHLSM